MTLLTSSLHYFANSTVIAMEYIMFAYPSSAKSKLQLHLYNSPLTSFNHQPQFNHNAPQR